MKKSRLFLFGAAMTALLCGGIAQAQDYGGPYYDRAYDPATGETVIVRPDYDRVQKRQLLGRVNGEVNPTEYTISQPVDISDLDLASAAGHQEVWFRVHQSARYLCHELNVQVPQLRGDVSADRECVRTATRNAMRDVGYRY